MFWKTLKYFSLLNNYKNKKINILIPSFRGSETILKVHIIYISGHTLGTLHTAFTAQPHWLLEVGPNLLRNTANPICWFPMEERIKEKLANEICRLP